jgi:hypothetical protein
MNSVEHSGDVFSCMLNIQHALKKHDVYKDNYHGMMQLPIVQKLKKQNKRLKEQIRILRGETQKKSKLYKNVPKKEEEEEEEDDDDVVIIVNPPVASDKVVIKIEPKEVVQPVVVKEEKNETSKVVYELIEKEEEEEEEEEEVEEEEIVVVEEDVGDVEEEEEEYVEVTINGVSYCTSDQENGNIYELTEDGDIGEVKGVYKNGVPNMNVVSVA